MCCVLTTPTFTQLIYSIQSHSQLAQPLVSPSLSPPATTAHTLSQDDSHCRVCQSPFNGDKKLLCDTCNAGWHMDCLILPPPTPHHHPNWDFQMSPMYPPPLLIPGLPYDTSASHQPSLTLTLVKPRPPPRGKKGGGGVDLCVAWFGDDCFYYDEKWVSTLD